MEEEREKVVCDKLIADQIDCSTHKIVEDTIKIVLYQVAAPEDVDQWISEIASAIADCSSAMSMYNKEQTCQNFKLSLLKWLNNSDLSISSEMCKKVKVACLDIVDRTTPLLCDKVRHHRKEYELELKDVFDTYL